MSKNEKPLVPKLRFPEFRDYGGWETGLLGNKKISIFINNRVSLKNLSLNTYVSTENLLPDFAGVCKVSKLPPSGSFTSYKEGDVLLSNIRPYLKKVWVADRSGASSNDVIVIRSGEEMHRNFLTYVLKNDQFINYIMASAKGVKMPRGDISSIKSYPVAYPTEPKEQQKIADCLSSLDELITAEAQKLDTLKAHKKGLMQKLFPAEGETVPRLRFPEFRDAWESKKLKSLLIEARLGGNYENSESNEGIPLIKMGNIDRGTINIKKIQFLPDGLEYSKEDFLNEGDILFNTRNTLELVGKVSIWLNELPKAIYNSNLLRLRFNKELESSNRFANYMFNTGITIKHLSSTLSH